ncbi:SusC/RagA family TonB-linked outer membrane protein [Saccharicrinis sp. FJH54]|uniref:SusC/RagA family TonB-linked outer membrane protein n=1 Tax=Saccharicrinis sp. FJH54 TaxID=3344665 RepID=UPI0035D4FC36
MKSLLLFLCVFLSGSAFSQLKTVSGIVTDQNKEPLTGVTVMVKESSVGTITDINGQFSVRIPQSGGTLIFSFVGFERKEIKVTDNVNLSVVLKESDVSLNEFVVVGYGIQKKVSVVGAVGTVDNLDLVRTNSSTTATALVGKVAGITNRQTSGVPGASTSLQIRNLGTPLYVIDGVMKDEGTFNNIDINDIESISILKDGSAAIYGVKASNGVVLVTTKRGKLNQKNTVNINSYYGMQNLTYFPRGTDAYTLMRGKAEQQLNDLGYTSITADDLEKYKTGYYNPETGEDYRSFDWYDFSVKKNVPQKYLNVSTSGGSEKINYYFSFSTLDQDAVFEDFNFSRKNMQINSDAKITESLKVSVSVNGRVERRNAPAIVADNDYKNLRWGLLFMSPTERPYVNDNPDYPAFIKHAPDYNTAIARRDIAGYSNDLWRVMQSNWDIEYKTPLKGLTAKLTYSYYLADNKMDNFRKYITLYDPTVTDSYVPVESYNSNVYFRKRNRYIEENMYRANINYHNIFGKHELGLVFAGEASERKDRTWQNDKTNIRHNYDDFFSDNDKEGLSYIRDDYWEGATAGFIGKINYSYAEKYLLEVAGRYDGSSKWAPEKRWGFFPSISGGWRISEENFIAGTGFGRVISNLKLRASYGEMGDENMPTGSNGYNYFDYLAGFTYSTSVNSGAYMASTPFENSITGTSVPGVVYDNIPKTNVTWIRTSMSNIGLDLGFFKNRLSVELDGFVRERRGLLGFRDDLALLFPEEVGYDLPVENLTSDRHFGIDGFTKWEDRIKKLHYWVGINFTFSRKMDYELYGAAFENSWDEYRTSTNKRWAGQNWAYHVIGRFQSQEEIDNYPVYVEGPGLTANKYLLPGDFMYEDINNDGIINGYDARPVGYAVGNNGQQLLPILAGGFNFGLNWKGFDFAGDFAGGSLFSYFQDYEVKWPFQAKDGNTPSYLITDAWHREDPLDPTSDWIPGRYPAVRGFGYHSIHSNTYVQSDFWLHRISYVRLKNVELGYSLPQSITNKINIKKCRIYVNATNILTFDNMHHLGLDPEMDERNGMGYPIHKVLSFGTNITF